MAGPDTTLIKFDAPLPPSLHARFRVESLLGRGGMGVVLGAIDQLLDRPVALKLLNPEAATSIDRERFAQEIQVLARFAHPRIVRIYEGGVAGDAPYLVMERVEGPTLSHRLRQGSLDEPQTIVVLRDILEALTHVHEGGVLHRDLKPSNIVLRTPGGATLIDFGLARLAQGSVDLTGIGVLVGTAAYLAPELVEGSKFTAGTDLFAVGMLGLECLQGSTPHEDSHDVEGIFSSLCTGTYLEVAASRCRDQGPIGGVLLRAIARDPALRFPSARAMRDALDVTSRTAPASPRRSRRASLPRAIGVQGMAPGFKAVEGPGGHESTPESGTRGPPESSNDPAAAPPSHPSGLRPTRFLPAALLMLLIPILSAIFALDGTFRPGPVTPTTPIDSARPGSAGPGRPETDQFLAQLEAWNSGAGLRDHLGALNQQTVQDPAGARTVAASLLAATAHSTPSRRPLPLLRRDTNRPTFPGGGWLQDVRLYRALLSVLALERFADPRTAGSMESSIRPLFPPELRPGASPPSIGSGGSAAVFGVPLESGIVTDGGLASGEELSLDARSFRPTQRCRIMLPDPSAMRTAWIRVTGPRLSPVQAIRVDVNHRVVAFLVSTEPGSADVAISSIPIWSLVEGKNHFRLSAEVLDSGKAEIRDVRRLDVILAR